MKFTTPLSFILLLFTSCETTDPPPPPPAYEPSIELAVVDTGLVDARLRIRFLDSSLQRAFRLRRNGQTVLNVENSPADTVVTDDSLRINTAYEFKALRVRDGAVSDSSSAADVTTLDTTSHNFTWQMDTLGVTSSVLYDVAILDDTLAYAVGEMYLRDSTGQIDPIPYCIAVWNGYSWTLRKLYYGSGTPIISIRGIHIESSTDVWLAAGSVFHWDGLSPQAQLSFSRLTLPNPNGTVDRLWGTGSNLYGVGGAGTIVSYNGTAWEIVNTGTTLDVNDIWGSFNSFTQETEIMAIASHFTTNQGVKLFSISGTQAQELSVNNMPWRMSALWFSAGKRYYVVGDGLMTKRTPRDTSAWDNLAPGVTIYYMRAIRGTGINDVIVVGDFGNLLHFNGLSWRSFQGETPSNAMFFTVAVQSNRFIAAGLSGNRGIVLRGSRQ